MFPHIWVPVESLILSALQSSSTSHPWELILSVSVSLTASLHLISHPWTMGQCPSQPSLSVTLSVVPEKGHVLICPAGPVGALGQ